MDKHNYTKFSVAFSVFKFVSVAKPQQFKKKKKSDGQAKHIPLQTDTNL